MAKPLTPRSLRGNALFDLEGQYEELLAMSDDLIAFDVAWSKFRAHFERRLRNANHFRYSAVGALSQADEIEQTREVWDGHTERRVASVDLSRVAA